jgi:hypothetical protein
VTFALPQNQIFGVKQYAGKTFFFVFMRERCRYDIFSIYGLRVYIFMYRASGSI